MLLKNFGVTRHGRVVFYDYDELCFLLDCKFRRFPPAASYEDELASEPWFHVNEGDIFPEEFAHFLGLSGEMRTIFNRFHGDLFDTELLATNSRTTNSRRTGSYLPLYAKSAPSSVTVNHLKI